MNLEIADLLFKLKEKKLPTEDFYPIYSACIEMQKHQKVFGLYAINQLTYPIFYDPFKSVLENVESAILNKAKFDGSFFGG